MKLNFLIFFALGAIFSFSTSAQTSWSDPLRKILPPHGLYNILPQSPVRVFSSDQQRRGGANSRLIVFGRSSVPQLLSMRQEEINERSVISSRIPNGVSIGEKSLFYMKDDESTEFVFTNSSRTRVHYASTATDYPVISPYSCGPFERISDIHLVELNGVLQRLIVADEKANRIYSYTIDPADEDLCTNEVSVAVTQPKWIRSPNVAAGTTLIFVGSQNRNSLDLTRYRATDLTVLTASASLSNVRGNSFGEAFVDPLTSDLFIPIRATRDATNGDDHVVHYLADFSDSTRFKTCRSPDQILQDFDADDPFRYVLCTSSKKIHVFNEDDERVAIFSAGDAPVKMVVGSDADDRFIAVIQKNRKLQLHRVAIEADIVQSEVVSSVLELPISAVEGGHFGALDEIVLVGEKEGRLVFVDLIAQTIRDEIQFPLSIDDLAVQDANSVHFISRAADAAYTWDELASGVWQLLAYEVGEEPVQLERRGNLLYVLNSSSDELSIVNTTTGVVANLPTPQTPVSFDWDAGLNELWIANAGAESYSVVDITVGAEVVDDEIALTFSPEKVLFQTSDDTLYFSGGSEVEVFSQSNHTSLKTESFSSSLHGMVLVEDGVQVFSRNLGSAFYLDRTTRAEMPLDDPAHFLVSSGTTAVTGSMNSRRLSTSDDFSSVVRRFEKLFSTASYFGIWESSPRLLRMFPYDLVSANSFPSLAVDLAILPDLLEDDGADNIWIADSRRRLFQRLSSNFQPAELRDRRKNRPVDLLGVAALERLYVALRNSNMLAVVDTDTATVSFYAACERPSQVLYDSEEDRVYMLCPASKSLSVFGLDASGDVTSQSLLGLEDRPEKMALHTADGQLFVIHAGASSLLAFDTSDMSLDQRLVLPNSPRDLALNAAADELYIVSESAEEITVVDTSNYSVSFIPTGSRGLDRLVFGAEVHAVSRSLTSIFHQSLDFTPMNLLTLKSWPAEMAYSVANEKVLVTYPLANALKIMNEDSQIESDLDVGARVNFVVAYDPLDLAFLSSAESDEIIVVDTNGDVVDARIELSEGCRPGRMNPISLGGTHYLYVACEGNDSLEVIDLSDNSRGNPLQMRLSPL